MYLIWNLPRELLTYLSYLICFVIYRCDWHIGLMREHGKSVAPLRRKANQVKEKAENPFRLAVNLLISEI